MLPLKQELEARGYLKQYTDEKLFDLVDQGWINFYFWVDPSADSMTIGNFVALMQAIHVMLRGNKCYLVVGGATWMIGNPTGKDQERNFLDEEQLAKNQQGIFNDFQRVCANVEQVAGKKIEFEIVNNYDRFKDMNYIQFLREVGKSMTVNWMMNKDIVRKRITDPDKFISYAEFSYMLIMGYDFFVLNRDHGVILEVWWSDERDGILAWIEITSKLNGNEVYGITNNLILDSTGRKFGKSEWNAIWLNPQKNSPYFVYQYFMNVADEDIARFLKLFSFLNLEEIDRIQQEHDQKPELRMGQKKLAYLVCQIIFGTQAADMAQRVTEFMFADNKVELLRTCDAHMKQAIAHEVWQLTLGGSVAIVDALVDSTLCESRWEAKKLIEQGWISVDWESIKDINAMITDNNVLIQKGKKHMRIIL